MARRAVLGWSRLLVRWIMAATATLVVLAGLLVWRVSQAPLSLGFLVPYVAEALSLSEYGIAAEVDDVVLAWSEHDEALRLRIYNARYRAEGGRVAMRVPILDMALSGRALLRGVVAPRYLHAAGLEARIIRDREGRFLIGVPVGETTGDSQPSAGPDAPLPVAEGTPPGDLGQMLLGALFQEMSEPRGPGNALGQLETVSVLADRLVIEDWKLDQRWIVPGAQITFQRGDGHVFANASGNLDWRSRRVSLNVSADYVLAERAARVVVNFDNIEPSDFADVVPELSPLSYLQTPLGGSVTMRLNENGEQLDLGFDLAAGTGTIQAPGELAAPLQLRDASFRGVIEQSGRLLRLDEASLSFADDFHLTLSGSVTREPAVDGRPERIGIEIGGQFFDMPTDSLPHYWPLNMARNARDWVTGHLQGGAVTAGRFSARLSPEMVAGTARLPADAVRLGFAFEGLNVDYLAPMTRLTGGKGVASLDADSFSLTVEEAKVGPLMVAGGDVVITGLQDRDQVANITSTAQGSSRDLLALIDQKPLGFPSKLGIRPAVVEGEGRVKWRLKFPLESNLRLDDLTVSAEASLTGLAIPGLMQGRYGLSDGSMTLKVDNRGLEAKGDAALNGVPAQIGWRQTFDGKAAVQARYHLEGRFDEAQRKALGYPLAPWIDGPAQAVLEIEERRGGEVAVGGEFDLTAAVIDLAEAHIAKPAGIPARGQILVRTRTGQPVQFERIAISGDGLALQARAVLPPGGGWSAEIARLQYGNGEIAGRIAFNAAGDAEIDLHGRRWDLRPFVKEMFGDDAAAAGPGAEPARKPRLVAALRLDEAVADDGLEMRNLSLQLRREPTRLEQVTLTGGFEKAGGVTLQIAPRLGGRQLDLVSDNAGAVLHFLGVTDMQGGTMLVKGQFDDTKPGGLLAGKMEMKNVRAIRAPFLARLLGIGSFTGLSAVLNSEQGILFETGEVPFSQKDAIVTIGDSRLQGPQLGITFGGTINNRTKAVNVSGTAVPAFVLNTILGKIPILGDLFVGDGIIGVNFAVSGPKADPQFTVNPLSAIAPGFLRKIFQAPQEKVPDPAARPEEKPAEPPVPQVSPFPAPAQ
ncbi:AsmA-like C-terminal domain-containing protein [Ferrovibrio sp.]|uniref:YhdP family protein n=2 Tax=Ferrovibrio sp. TaxID=1917215 RepID=UPI0035145F76